VRHTTSSPMLSASTGLTWRRLSGRCGCSIRSFAGWLARSGTPCSFDDVRELLEEHSFEVDERCRVHWRRPSALEATLVGLNDPSGIRAELERIRR
jgi:hypothetical protein